MKYTYLTLVKFDTGRGGLSTAVQDVDVIDVNSPEEIKDKIQHIESETIKEEEPNLWLKRSAWNASRWVYYKVYEGTPEENLREFKKEYEYDFDEILELLLTKNLINKKHPKFVAHVI